MARWVAAALAVMLLMGLANVSQGSHFVGKMGYAPFLADIGDQVVDAGAYSFDGFFVSRGSVAQIG